MMRSHSDGVTPSAAMPNFMADRGARLVDAGYSILPIAPGAKCPGQYSNSNGWRGLTDWVRFCDRQPTALELEIWSGWPGCGIGIPGGRAVGIDIDVLDSDVALQIEALAQAELGATPAIRIGRNPKRLLVYRAKAVFQKFALHPIEVIAHGGQFVAYAIHPDTGEPYRWPVEDLSEIELASLPTVTEESCRRFLDAAIRLVPPELRQSQLGPDRHAEYYYAPGGDLRGTLPAVGAALSFIANDDLPYDDWIRIGMALKGGLGEAGWPLFQAWSGGSSKDKPETTAKAWRSLKPNRIGAGTIYGYALERGWLPDSDLILNGALAEVVAKPVHPAAGFLARIEAEIATEAETKAQEAALAKTPMTRCYRR